jgi:hypothetical protein
MSPLRKIAILLSVSLFIVCVLLDYFYRPYIYQNHIFDFHFADTYTSWIGIPCGTLLFWGAYGKERFTKILFSCLMGAIAYELVGLTFDWYDIIALIISTLITYLIYFAYKRHRNKHL